MIRHLSTVGSFVLGMPQPTGTRCRRLALAFASVALVRGSGVPHPGLLPSLAAVEYVVTVHAVAAHDALSTCLRSHTKFTISCPSFP